MADLVVADFRGDTAQRRTLRRKEVADLEVAVTSEHADGEVIAGVADVRKVAEPAHIHQNSGRRESQLHQRDQRHSTGEQLGFVAVLGERGDGRIHGVGLDVLERRGDHFAAPVSAAARTAFTMLW